MMNRRRFLTISAAACATPAWGETHRWQGRAFGAEIGMTIRGPAEIATEAIATARATVAEVEAQFSLYDPASALRRLNATGVLVAPDPLFIALMQQADAAHRLTGGLFDPTVQPLWRAHATGEDVAAARHLVGWERVAWDPGLIQLDRGQALTFNGIAQGFATDLVTERFAALGLQEVLVNIGEYRALGGPWQLAISDPVHGMLGKQTLDGAAIATSSPGAMTLGAAQHILHPARAPRWSTVSVEAATATMADYLSTSLSLAPQEQIAALIAQADIIRVTLIDFNGDLRSLS